jgi:DNA-binding protein HU-beta
MEMQALVNEFKGRAGRVGTQTQDAILVYINANKQAYDVLSDNVQNLAKAEMNTALDFYGVASERFGTARKESVRNLIFVPVDIWPEGRERLLTAYREAFDQIIKTRDELSQVIRDGFKDIRVSLFEAQNEAKKAVDEAATQAREGVKEAKTEAEKSAPAQEAKKTATQAKKTATRAKKTAAQAKKTATQAKPATRKKTTTAKSGTGTRKTTASGSTKTSGTGTSS